MFAIYLIAHVLSSVLNVIPYGPFGLKLLSCQLTLVAGSTYFPIGIELIKPRQQAVRRWALASTVCVVVAAAIATAIRSSRGAVDTSVVFAVYASACVLAFLGVLHALVRHRCLWPTKVLLFSATAGAVDALLPTFAAQGVPIWEPAFLGRAIDVTLWLPGALLALRWLDAQPPPSWYGHFTRSI